MVTPLDFKDVKKKPINRLNQKNWEKINLKNWTDRKNWINRLKIKKNHLIRFGFGFGFKKLQLIEPDQTRPIQLNLNDLKKDIKRNISKNPKPKSFYPFPAAPLSSMLFSFIFSHIKC
jgi:hypothetical protein